MSQRLAELAQQIDTSDSLACIDSLSEKEGIASVKDDATILVTKTVMPDMSPASRTRLDLERQISDVNAQIKDIETRQLLNELESLEKEILSVSVTSGGSRNKWMVTDIEIACDDLRDNSVMTYSYENVASVLSDSVSTVTTSTETSSICDIDINDPPKPRKATLPSPVPNYQKFNFKKPVNVKPCRPLVEHTGAVGVTSMWIPSSDNLSLNSPSNGNCQSSKLPKIQPKCANANSFNISNKSSQRINIRDNGAINKKLQIQNILPNKHKAEGSLHH